MAKESPSPLLPAPADAYRDFLRDLKARVLSARVQAARAVTRELVLLYWDMGRGISERQQSLGWGMDVVRRLALDLQGEFPGMKGFSASSLWRMAQFYRDYSSPEFMLAAKEALPSATAADPEKLAQAVREMAAMVPWGHHVTLLGRIEDPKERLFYLQATAEYGWSRNILLNQVKAQAYARSKLEKKSNNFRTTLSPALADQAAEAMKSSYNLEFLGIRKEVRERELEDRLASRLKDFLLELGYGFCFVGRQHRLALRGKEYFVDLLFYHRGLRALIAFELKVGAFQPEYAGKLDFYLNLLNDFERMEGDAPSIGIILCAEKDDVEVEYALKSKDNPIGVAEYHLSSRLPAEFRGKLPTARQLTSLIREALPPGESP